MHIRDIMRSIDSGLSQVMQPLKKPFFPELMVLGDSHMKVFRSAPLNLGLWQYYINLNAVGGATASGINNENSKTRAGAKMREAIAASKAKLGVICIGEVDIGYAMWLKAKSKERPIEEMLEVALENYRGLLLEMKAKMKVFCISAPLPTIGDGDISTKIGRKRQHLGVPFKDRLDMTLRFNKSMNEFCDANDIYYLNLDEVCMEDGVVASFLQNKNPDDFHYDRTEYAKLIAPELKKVLKTIK